MTGEAIASPVNMLKYALGHVKEEQYMTNTNINPRPAGPLDFPPTAGGGGV